MNAPSWQAADGGPTVLEDNWLLRLYRQRFVSRASGKQHDFYVMNLADAVTVIALTPDQHVVLVRQFRAGSGRDGLEPPGGLLDDGEDVCQAAERELLEETGYAGDTPRVLSTHWSMPSLLTSRITTVLIENAQPVAEPTPDHEEELDLQLAPAGAIPGMIADGRIHHALAVVGLLEWLISQFPGTPWHQPPRVAAQPLQFRIRSLIIAVALSAVSFATLRFLGSRGSILAIGTLAAIAPSLLWPLMYPVKRPILLRGLRHSESETVARCFAMLGLWTAGVLLATAVVWVMKSLLGV